VAQSNSNLHLLTSKSDMVNALDRQVGKYSAFATFICTVEGNGIISLICELLLSDCPRANILRLFKTYSYDLQQVSS
jgi:hypothetical protein